MCARRRAGEVGPSGRGKTIALVFPLLGFGFWSSLVLLAVPPILINASTDLRQVSPQVIDAAKG